MAGESLKLNAKQQQAVDTIDGPLLVLAGPGTGKTQLLSARVAKILELDNSPSNILCLTFTESGAYNMRERLSSIIGQSAYDVHISTYHSFGSDIIKNYPEFFEHISVNREEDSRMERPVDELTQIEIVRHIIEKLPYDNPLLSARYYIKNVRSTISELKKQLITPDALRSLAHTNLEQIDAAQRVLNNVINNRKGLSRNKAENFTQFDELLKGLAGVEGELIRAGVEALQHAYTEAEATNKTNPLTSWKNNWLHKDEDDNYSFTDRRQSEKMIALAGVYEMYQSQLRSKGLYDFDDMILRAIDAINKHDELRYNLQEKYQYILLDEFQDTNASQFELVKIIADHPVHEGRPNIMAVGDDDQAIFAFQGAEVGNMHAFREAFRDVVVINLDENYRSHADILHVAHNISEQIENRLHHTIEGIEKTLAASSDALPDNATIERHEFASNASEYAWVAQKINELIASGIPAKEIAVLSPQHKLLEALVPFMTEKNTPIRYERRENILTTEIVSGLRLQAELIIALADNQVFEANRLFPIVLSFEYWGIPVKNIWQVNWQKAKRDETRSWAEIALEDELLSRPVQFMLALANKLAAQPLEYMLDYMSGVTELELAPNEPYRSPLQQHYFSAGAKDQNTLRYYESLSHLSVIRAKLRDYQQSQEELLTLKAFVALFDLYETAEESLINSHPIAQSDDAVELMTAYKAKGLEFEYVFILSAHDDVWGPSAKRNNNSLSLPPNLQFIRYVAADEDELRRLLFVAITRAKHGLFITSHSMKDNGKQNKPIKYLNEVDGKIQVLPADKQVIHRNSESREMLMHDVDTMWHSRHLNLQADLVSLLRDRLQKYQMSPTHLNSFVDLTYGGPEAFLMNTILRFPQSPGVDGEYGTAIHNTLEWYQQMTTNNSRPSLVEAQDCFKQELSHRYVPQQDVERLINRGSHALARYLESREKMFDIAAKAEVNFYSEGVTIDNAHLSGKIDRLEIDEKTKTIAIVDYKTGSGYHKWKSDLKLYKYKQQLYFYKLLVENSNSYSNYRVSSCRLEFVEPNTKGDIFDPLVLAFDDKEEEELRLLIVAVWNHIINLDLPDTSSYKQDFSGTKQFITSLIQS